MKLEGIAGFRLVAHDGDALTRFYAALGFEADAARPIEPAEAALLGQPGGGLRRPMRLGEARLDLDQYARPGSAYNAGSNAASLCFQHLALVTGNVQASWSLARRAGALAISRNGPVTLPASAGGVTAVKFRDPEGHPLELIHFPDLHDKRWTGDGIVGIDHSAISVSDRVRTEAFYADLGLVCGAAALNHGPAQDALDGLDEVHVDVVPMRPREPRPHLELLHYRGQRTAACEAWSVNDVAATRIVWRGPGAALLRDPDGHLHQVGV